MPDVIGLDLSLTSTGMAIVGEEFTIQTKEKGMERIDYIADIVLAESSQFSDPYFIIEGYAFAKKGSHAHAQGELGGVIRHAIWKLGWPYVDVPPTVRAKFATGKGNASKSEVVSAVSAKTGKVFEGRGADDMADAWILREMGLVYFGEGQFEWPAKNMEAMEKVEWV
jgi:crossover junction endodeoxyribonuclease RuvC